MNIPTITADMQTDRAQELHPKKKKSELLKLGNISHKASKFVSKNFQIFSRIAYYHDFTL